MLKRLFLRQMDLDEKWIREHLPPGLKNESLDLFAEEYLDDLTVMAKGERGGPGKVSFRGRDLAHQSCFYQRGRPMGGQGPGI